MSMWGNRFDEVVFGILKKVNPIEEQATEGKSKPLE